MKQGEVIFTDSGIIVPKSFFEERLQSLTTNHNEEDRDLTNVLEDMEKNSGEMSLDMEYPSDNDFPETIEDYEIAIGEFKTQKGEKYFEENKGQFCLVQETRPFMTNLLNQSMLLWEDDQKEKAIKQQMYMLELNPNDNQGVRDTLINFFLELDLLDEAKI